MNITITTYIDNQKLITEKYTGKYEVQKNIHKIKYLDKNKKIFEIIIDKSKDNVSIIKDNVTMQIKDKKMQTKYSTEYGIFDLETKLENITKLEKNNFILFEINYKIYFSKKDKQSNRLKILVNRAKGEN